MQTRYCPKCDELLLPSEDKLCGEIERLRIALEKMDQAAKLVCIAHDFLAPHWDMDSAPLHNIKEFTERYFRSNAELMPN